MSIKLKDTIFDYIDKAYKDSSGNIISSTYLPKSGGTITNTLTIQRSPSVICFTSSKGSLLGYLGFGGDNTPIMYENDSATSHTLIHSGNIGSQSVSYATSSGNADTLDGLHNTGFLRFKHIGGLTNKDLNYANNMYGTWNYGDDSTQLNTPTTYYGAYISFGNLAASDTTTTRNQTAQIGVDCWNDLGRVYVRARKAGNRDVSSISSWKTLAFTTDNVASAAKLATARTIWGQSFDGTGDVWGGIDINGYMSSNSVTKIADLGTKGLVINANSIRGTWGMALWTEGNGNGYIQQQAFVGATTYPLCLQPFGGNVGIGTNNPSYKLHSVISDNSNYVVACFTNTLSHGGIAINSANSYNPFIRYQVNGTTKSECGYSNSKGNFYIGAYNTDSGHLNINIASGNVGIGTTNPTAKLHIASSLTGSDAPNSDILINGTGSYSTWHRVLTYNNSNLATGAAPNIYFGAFESKYNGGYIGFKYVGKDSSSNYVTIGLYAADNLVSILGNGNIGIGQTSPVQKLDVNGNILIPNWYALMSRKTDGTGINLIYCGNDDIIKIGGSLPIKLQGNTTVTGSIDLSGDWENDFGINFNEGGGATYGFSLLYGASDKFKLTTRNNSTTNTEVFSVGRGSTTVTFASTPKVGTTNISLEGHSHSNYSLTSHTHTKSQITDFPSSLPANGGNADTVDNIHASDFYKSGTAYPYGKSDKPWHKVASFTQSVASVQINTGITFYVGEFYAARTHGILNIQIRNEQGAVNPSFCHVVWSLNNGIDPNEFVVGHSYSGNTVTYNLYAWRAGWSSYNIRKIAEQAWGGDQDVWECYYAANGNSNCFASIPETNKYTSSNLTISNNAESASSVPWSGVTGKPSTFSPSSHTHSYAASSSAGGAATSANKLNRIDNTVNSTSNDTTSSWGSLGTSVHFYATVGQLKDQPSQYGLILNVTGAPGAATEVHQLWMTQASGNLAHRGGNASGWSGTWRTILDSSNWSSYCASSSHTHNYAGSSSSGGAANNSLKWGGYSIVVGSTGTDANTIYIVV